MANEPKEDRFSGPDPSQSQGRPDRAYDRPGRTSEEDPSAGAKSPLEDNDWRDQSQGPNHPRDDQGNKRA